MKFVTKFDPSNWDEDSLLILNDTGSSLSASFTCSRPSSLRQPRAATYNNGERERSFGLSAMALRYSFSISELLPPWQFNTIPRVACASALPFIQFDCLDRRSLCLWLRLFHRKAARPAACSDVVSICESGVRGRISGIEPNGFVEVFDTLCDRFLIPLVPEKASLQVCINTRRAGYP